MTKKWFKILCSVSSNDTAVNVQDSASFCHDTAVKEICQIVFLFLRTKQNSNASDCVVFPSSPLLSHKSRDIKLAPNHPFNELLKFKIFLILNSLEFLNLYAQSEEKKNKKFHSFILNFLAGNSIRHHQIFEL